MQHWVKLPIKRDTGFIVDRKKMLGLHQIKPIDVQQDIIPQQNSNQFSTPQIVSKNHLNEQKTQYQIRRVNRSPGAIIHLKKNHQDLSHIRTNFTNQKKHSSVERVTNPQADQFQISKQFNNRRTNFINFEYQQIEKNIQVRQNQEVDLINESFQELQEKENASNKYGSFDMKGYLGLHSYLKKLIFGFENRNNSVDMLNSARKYIQYVQSREDIDNLTEFKLQSLHKKFIRNAFLSERLTVLIVTFVEMTDCFQVSKKYLNNMLKYSLENYYLIGLLLTKGCDKQFNQIIKQEGKQSHTKPKVLNVQTIKTNSNIIIQSIYRLANKENLFYSNMRKIIKNNQSLRAMACFVSLLQYYAFYLWATDRADRVPFLSVSPSPFLRQLENTKYTLVIDILQVFCSKNRNSVQIFRPFSEHFLDQMHQYYQLVSICDSMPNQANRLLSILDRKNRIKHRLYKFHLLHVNGRAVKQLGKFGRNLQKTILIDSSTSFDESNTVSVPQWRGKKSDAELAQLCPLLAMIVIKGLSVPKALIQYRQKLQQNKKLGFKYSNYAVNLQ